MKSLYFYVTVLLLFSKGAVFATAPDKPLHSFREQPYCNSRCTVTHYLESVYEQSDVDFTAHNKSVKTQTGTSCVLNRIYAYYIDTRTPVLRFHITTQDEIKQVKYNLVIKENVGGKGWSTFTDYTSNTLPAGDVFYKFGTTENKLVGNYGKESLYSWSIQGENPTNATEQSSRLYNAQGTEATPHIAFRVPPYFVAYKTNGNPILMGDVTKSSITLQVNTPYILDRIAVKYGKDKGTYTKTVTKSNQTGIIRFALKGLAASTTYFYRIEWDASYDGNVTHRTAEYKFTTLKDNLNENVRFAIVTDLHQQSITYLKAGWHYENRLMPFFGTTLKNEDFDFVVDLGDYIPAERCRVQDEYDAFYAQELLIYQEMGTPSFIVPGNHEGISPRYCNHKNSRFQYFP